MAGTTPTYGLRYPELVDPPDGAALGKNLADDVEAELARIDNAHATDTAAADARLDQLEAQIVKAGRVLATSSAGGDIAVNFAVAFPTACKSVVLTQSGAPGYLGALSWRVNDTPSVSGFVFRVYDGGGNPLANIANVQFEWVAVGS